VQIAVQDAVAAAEVNPALDEFPPELLQAGHSHPGIDRGTAVRSALKAGALGVLISFITVPLLGVLLSGALAVYFYRRKNGFVLPAVPGSRLGGAAGVVSFAIGVLLVTIHVVVFHAQQEYIDGILKAAQKFGLNAADPEVQASIHSLSTPSGLAFICVFVMILVIVLASVGGALASLFLRPRNPRV